MLFLFGVERFVKRAELINESICHVFACSVVLFSSDLFCSLPEQVIQIGHVNPGIDSDT